MKVRGQLHVPAALPPGKEPGTNFMEGCVGPRADQLRVYLIRDRICNTFVECHSFVDNLNCLK